MSPYEWGLDFWASSDSDVFTVGDTGQIYHYDGVSWSLQDNPARPENPTLRIGEYNGLVLASDWTYSVWCGNEDDPNGVPTAHQIFFDSRPTTGVEIAASVPTSLPVLMLQNRPNPFAAITTINFELAETARVTLGSTMSTAA